MDNSPKTAAVHLPHHFAHASRFFLVMIPTSAPSFITGSLLILCSCISLATSRVEASRSMVTMPGHSLRKVVPGHQHENRKKQFLP